MEKVKSLKAKNKALEKEIRHLKNEIRKLDNIINGKIRKPKKNENPKDILVEKLKKWRSKLEKI